MTLRILSEKLLSDNWGKLLSVSYAHGDEEKIHQREVYDRGDGATILLYHPVKRTVILTRQFRLPVWMNRHPDGFFIEAPAGKVEPGESPEITIEREAEEEVGFRISSPRKIMSLYMSPGSVTELIHFYVAAYSQDMKISQGGGQKDEDEDIEVMEIPWKEAFRLVREGKIQDAKTVILLQFFALERIPGGLDNEGSV